MLSSCAFIMYTFLHLHLSYNGLSLICPYEWPSISRNWQPSMLLTQDTPTVIVHVSVRSENDASQNPVGGRKRHRSASKIDVRGQVEHQRRRRRRGAVNPV